MTILNSKITIVDYGTSNLRSVTRAFIKVGADINIASSIKDIERADRLILPGVGSFGNGMSMLKKLDLIHSLNTFIKKGNPLLGICLGMQMLLEDSEEELTKKGLSYIDGKVTKIPTSSKNEILRKIPQIGWNNLELHFSSISDNKIFSNIDERDFFYFIHSYMSKPRDPKKIIATYDCNNFKVTAAIRKANVIGLQFHPEISGKSGLKVINNFLNFY